jgi:hypothetical protein
MARYGRYAKYFPSCHIPDLRYPCEVDAELGEQGIDLRPHILPPALHHFAAGGKNIVDIFFLINDYHTDID